MQFVDIKNDIAFRKIFGNENKKMEKIMRYTGLAKEEIDEM